MSITKKVDVFEQKKTQKPVTDQLYHSELVDDFINLMDTWHATPEVWDDKLDADIHKMEYQVRTTHKPRLSWGKKGTKYFSPSSANSDARELYLKIAGAPRDRVTEPSFRGRWKRLGTVFGDVIQSDLLYIAKHYKRVHGKDPEYLPQFVKLSDRNGENTKSFPAWEKFAQRVVWVDHRGHSIPIVGQPDGILEHTPTGKSVGLEVKSKQTTSAQTSMYSMRAPAEDHIKQCVNYSIMYGVDDFIIFYGNLSKKGWFQTPEDYAKTPDVRAFHVHVTEEDRTELLDYYADILEAVEAKKPPKMNIEKWTFNNFKLETAKTVTDEELEEIRSYVERVKRSRLPKYKINSLVRALDDLEEVRSNVRK